jgi:hypothetical protein
LTAEIAILNKSAVALAADSAVTIETATGPKIYDSVNKLFALIKGRPVGVMIYDNADLMGVPWETIIKVYRMRRRSTTFAELGMYADDFLSYVAGTPGPIPRDLHDRYLEGAYERRFQAVRNRVNESARAAIVGRGRLARPKIRSFIDEAIVAERKLWDSQDDGPWANALDLERLRTTGRAQMDKLVTEVFQELPLLLRQRKDLLELAVSSLCKVPYGNKTPIDPRSGLVITGFGQEEYFPRLASFDIYGVVDGHLRSVPDKPITITVDNPAVIAPFAQREMVDAFVAGINPGVENGIKGFWRGLQQRLPKAVLDILEAQAKELTPATRASLEGPLRSLVLAILRDHDDHLRTLKDTQVDPIVNSVEFLPKDELAAMAESLVNLTSLKRRVSLDDPQTVGGPIDVAVISRGDGFVWIKRKHYFSLELNPTWATLVSDE